LIGAAGADGEDESVPAAVDGNREICGADLRGALDLHVRKDDKDNVDQRLLAPYVAEYVESGGASARGS
jgi:hypothetical protein